METSKFEYPYSKFWLVFWMILFFPVGLVLLSRLKVVSPTQTKSLQYDGSRFWLYFWAVLFCPVVILLFIFNGAFVKTPRAY